MKRSASGLILSLLPGLVLTTAAQCGTVSVGDEQLSVELSYGASGLVESQFVTHSIKINALNSPSWVIETDKGTVDSRGTEARLAKSVDGHAKEALFVGENKLFRWMARYTVSGPGLITKQLSLEPVQPLTVQRITMQQIPEVVKPVISSTNLLDIAAFCRQDAVGMFASLDFPYSKIRLADTMYSVSYPPFEKLKADQTYDCHSLTLGATTLTGKVRYNFYEGEVEAMDRYIQSHEKPRFEKPMFTSACIVNRYTQIQNGAIFYTMKDHPTLSMNQDIMRREISLLPKLGMEYYQIFPGVFDWVPDDPSADVVEGLVAYAKRTKYGLVTTPAPVRCSASTTTSTTIRCKEPILPPVLVIRSSPIGTPVP